MFDWVPSFVIGFKVVPCNSIDISAFFACRWRLLFLKRWSTILSIVNSSVSWSSFFRSFFICNLHWVFFLFLFITTFCQFFFVACFFSFLIIVVIRFNNIAFVEVFTCALSLVYFGLRHWVNSLFYLADSFASWCKHYARARYSLEGLICFFVDKVLPSDLVTLYGPSAIGTNFRWCSFEFSRSTRRKTWSFNFISSNCVSFFCSFSCTVLVQRRVGSLFLPWYRATETSTCVWNTLAVLSSKVFVSAQVGLVVWKARSQMLRRV